MKITYYMNDILIFNNIAYLKKGYLMSNFLKYLKLVKKYLYLFFGK